MGSIPSPVLKTEWAFIEMITASNGRDPVRINDFIISGCHVGEFKGTCFDLALEGRRMIMSYVLLLNKYLS